MTTTDTAEELEDIQNDIRKAMTDTTPEPDHHHITNTETLIPTHQTWTSTEAAELLEGIPITELERMDATTQQRAVAHRVHEIVRSQLEFTRRRDALITNTYSGPLHVDTGNVPTVFDQ